MVIQQIKRTVTGVVLVAGVGLGWPISAWAQASFNFTRPEQDDPAQPVTTTDVPESQPADATTPPEDEEAEDTSSVVKTQDGMITELVCRGAPLHTVLHQLTRKTRTNIIFSKGVTGEVTISLYDVKLEDALDNILRQNGLTYRQEGRFIYIYTQEELDALEKAEKPLLTRTYRLNYISPSDADTFLKPLLSEQGSIILGPQTSGGDGTVQAAAIEDLIAITDYEENLTEIEKNLTLIDQRPRQVLVEATILRATLNESNALGIDFNVLNGVDFKMVAAANGNSGVIRNGVNLSGTSGSTGGTGSTGTDGGSSTVNAGGEFNQLTNAVPLSKIDDLTFGSSTEFARSVPSGGLSFGLVGDEISAFLRALEAVTDVAVMANPKVLVLNKQTGTVLVGGRDGYLTTSTSTTTTNQTVNFLETGTQLQFTPIISNDGYVRLSVTPSDSTGGVNSLGLPFERTTEVTTNILVKDGHTVLIGGLFREVDTAGRSQIPLLGSIPVLGQAFGSTADSTIREEVIILLTVHVVDNEDDYADYSQSVLEDMERVRVGVRNSMQWHGRERLAQANYQIALDEATKGHKHRALWHTTLAIHNNPRFVEALKLREELLEKRSWDADGTITREFIHNAILREQGLPPQVFGRPMRPAQQQLHEETDSETIEGQAYLGPYGFEGDAATPTDQQENAVLGPAGFDQPVGQAAPAVLAAFEDGTTENVNEAINTSELTDTCPDDPDKTEAGVCGCGLADGDLDSDGALDCRDGCPDDATKTSPGICGCGVADVDVDGDGALTCMDQCPEDATKTAPGVCGCGVADRDRDGDGLLDCQDGCPSDQFKTAAGVCGCGVVDADLDGDGYADCTDLCPGDPYKTEPGVCGCDLGDGDLDSDGAVDCHDGCPDDPYKTSPEVCGCGVRDTDSDGDHTFDCDDECPQDISKIQPGACGCGVADLDTDLDQTSDCVDRCPNDAGKIVPGQCGCGVLDTDTDGDQTADCIDACPSDAQKVSPGVCGCGQSDADRDGDGTADCLDACPDNPQRVTPGAAGCQ
ncbi:MAG: hypothetical protein HJJLKODD_01750 [Phycisphaerae bacterium]|nr:hypothetical protein [Phycisphaerae bacterium]